MSHRSIDAPRPNVVPGAHRRSQPEPLAKSDLMPFMALLGAVYGWLLVVLAVVVSALVALLG